MSEEVRLVINLHSTPGDGDRYAQAWRAHCQEVAVEDGCLQYELFRSVLHPDNLALLELWRDRAAFDAHWDAEMKRAPVGREYIAPGRTRELGRDSVEVYWERQEQRYDFEVGLWTPRHGRS